MRPVLVKCHRRGRTSHDLSPPSLDLDIPRFRRVGISFVVKTTEQLQSKVRAFLGRKFEDVLKHLAAGHKSIIADLCGVA
jgi:hypothetical protein